MNTFSRMKPQWLIAAALLVSLHADMRSAAAEEAGFARLPDDPEIVRQVSHAQPDQGIPVYVGEARDFTGYAPDEQPAPGTWERFNRILDGEEPLPGAMYTSADGEQVYPPITSRFRWWCQDHAARAQMRRAHNAAVFWAHFHCKFGCLIPNGCGGHGCPPVGAYHRVYALDPQYSDVRDSKLYAAQGYGAPMTVPLAPTVRHSYNYGWGIPSSRLTPMTRITPYPVYGY